MPVTEIVPDPVSEYQLQLLDELRRESEELEVDARHLWVACFERLIEDAADLQSWPYDGVAWYPVGLCGERPKVLDRAVVIRAWLGYFAGTAYRALAAAAGVDPVAARRHVFRQWRGRYDAELQYARRLRIAPRETRQGRPSGDRRIW